MKPHERDEAELKALFVPALAGDNAAYARFLSRAALRVRAFLARRLVQRPDDVEDLVQETLLAVHNHRATWRPSEPVTPWLLAIARHKMIDALRFAASRGRTDVSLDADSAFDALHAEALADPHSGAPEARRDLALLIASLPDRFAAAILAVKIEGLSVAEAAARLGMSDSAVKVNVHRGLKRLASQVQGNAGHEDR